MKTRSHFLIAVILLTSLTTELRAQYCQYCFYSSISTYDKEVVVSNVFSMQKNGYRKRDVTCSLDQIEIRNKRRDLLQKYSADTTWTVVEETDYQSSCNETEEQQIEVKKEQNRIDRDRTEAERITREGQELKDRIDAEKAKEKEDLLKYYNKFDQKPQRIPDGWHKVEVLNESGFRVMREVRVENNEVRGLKIQDYPGYEHEKEIRTSTPIAKANAMIQTEKGYWELFFTPYLQNDSFRAAPPQQNKKVLWWFKGLNSQWRKVISGDLQGSALADGKKVSFKAEAPSAEDLEAVHRIDRIEIRITNWENHWMLAWENQNNLLSSNFDNLQEASIIIKDDQENYTLTFNSLDKFREMSKQLFVLQKIDKLWRRLLSGGYGLEYGGFKGDFRVNLDLYSLNEQSLRSLERDLASIDRLKFPPDLDIARLPDLYYLTNLKVVQLNENQSASFYNLFWHLPHRDQLVRIYACDTPAAAEWSKMRRINRKKALDEIWGIFKVLELMEFCLER